MFATIHAAKSPPATARTSTTTAAMTHPIAPFERRGPVPEAAGGSACGGEGGVLGVTSSLTSRRVTGRRIWHVARGGACEQLGRTTQPAWYLLAMA